MTPALRSFLHWTPRGLGCCFVAFVAMFALDVFGEQQGVVKTLVAFAIHLIPAAIVLVAVAIAWRWPWTGALLFCGLGTYYCVSVWDHAHWSWYVTIAVPCFLLGLLYLADAVVRWKMRLG